MMTASYLLADLSNLFINFLFNCALLLQVFCAVICLPKTYLLLSLVARSRLRAGEGRRLNLKIGRRTGEMPYSKEQENNEEGEKLKKIKKRYLTS